MRPEVQEIAKRITDNRLDWQEVKKANEYGWQIRGKTIYLTDWELEWLREVTKL